MRKKIVFLNPPVSLEELFGSFHFAANFKLPINLLYLAAVTRQQGFETHVIDPQPRGLNIEDCISMLKDIRPDYVAISFCFTNLFPHSLMLAARVKEELDIPVIAGGVHFSATPEETMNLCPAIDYGIIGEGETTIQELLQALNEGGGINSVKGIIHRDGNALRRTEARLLIKDIDALPFPAWDLVNLEDYRAYSFENTEARSTILITTRGCPYACSFCDRTVLGRTFRPHSLDYSFAMIDHLHERYGINDIDVKDENIGLDRKYMTAFCGRMKERPHLTFSCNMRAHNVNREDVEHLKAAHCRMASFGLESGSDKMLNLYQKKVKVAEMKETLRLFNDTGIYTYGSFIVGGPGETDETLFETLKFIKDTRIDQYTFWHFVPYAGTPVYADLHKYGTILTTDLTQYTGQSVVFLPNGFTEEQLIQWKKKLLRTSYFRLPFILNKIKSVGSPGKFYNYAKLAIRLAMTLK